ncbi:MAG: hypothetical protein FD126_207 [Elusimicrobia bacterium]|nr:MAG: hypothetical protein FD126_207 [Elusimicrobiota bacterium]
MLEIFEIPKEERPKTLLLTLYFFLIIAAFWIQKPLRTSKFVKAVGVENLPWAKLGTALLILPVMMLYSAIIRRMPRGYAAFTCSLVFVGGSLFFWRVFTGQAPDWAHYTYFFYIDIYITVMLAAFWSLAHATTPPEQAKRTYAVVGAGGILGGACGSAITGWLVKVIGANYLMLVCAAVLLAVAWISWKLSQMCALPMPEPDPDPGFKRAVAGARLTFADPYLLAIAGMVACYEIVSNIIDYQFSAATAAAFTGEGDLAAFIGKLSTANIGVSVLVQLLATSIILRRWGPRGGVMVLPVILGVLSAAYLGIPTVAVAALLFSSDATFHYSINQTSKETLYTPTDEAVKYQAKAFIDMFVFRVAKGVSALMILFVNIKLKPAGWNAPQLSIISLAFVLAWTFLARSAGRRFDALSTPAA